MADTTMSDNQKPIENKVYKVLNNIHYLVNTDYMKVNSVCAEHDLVELSICMPLAEFLEDVNDLDLLQEVEPYFYRLNEIQDKDNAADELEPIARDDDGLCY